ncbi:globin [Mesorhizobium albiziae]|uniref:Globin n=1 Tax=Neomesorhizobium albiziae TaxID=335020 RepID=A0A1I4FDD7_9HYPH|nr:hypothetical protein [Mesorhizobium albiziae]GLS30853.1 hypothetical protein GCM10007937_25620 [Mesorhizobium albiziae]SFL15483.1 globin [Mesorhizobium albiziae]
MQSTEVSDSIFIRLGVGPAIRVVVDEFHDVIETGLAYSGVKALHRSGSADLRISLAGWLSRLGGSKGWFDQPRPCSAKLHPSLPVYAHFPAQRLQAMRCALKGSAIDPRLAAHLQQHLTKMADAMAAR